MKRKKSYGYTPSMHSEGGKLNANSSQHLKDDNLNANGFQEVAGGFLLTREQLAKIESTLSAKDATIAALNQKLNGKNSNQANDTEKEKDKEDTDAIDMEFQKDILNRID